MLFAPAKAFERRVKLFLGWRDNTLAVQRDEIFLAFDPCVESRAYPPDAGTMLCVRAM
jgi:hypothetical protein